MVDLWSEERSFSESSLAEFQAKEPSPSRGYLFRGWDNGVVRMLNKNSFMFAHQQFNEPQRLRARFAQQKLCTN